MRLRPDHEKQRLTNDVTDCRYGGNANPYDQRDDYGGDQYGNTSYGEGGRGGGLPSGPRPGANRYNSPPMGREEYGGMCPGFSACV
jgi:hypothetical protein